MYHSTTHLAHGIDITDIEAQYDENAKALMADKQVLSRIAKYRTDEFKDYDIPTIIARSPVPDRSRDEEDRQGAHPSGAQRDEP